MAAKKVAKKVPGKFIVMCSYKNGSLELCSCGARQATLDLAKKDAIGHASDGVTIYIFQEITSGESQTTLVWK